VIRSSGQSLLTILNDILDVSKIEAGALVLESVPFDLEQVVRGAAEGFSAVAEGKSVDLWVDMEPGVEGARIGDPARIRQILANLISNALKFTHVGAVAVRVEMQDGGDGLRLIVTDTGIGMPADKLWLLFQKFTQLDSSTTRRFGGTGLGLSICHELTSMMGGRIWAESVEGRGSSFFVELPLVRVADTGADDALADGVHIEEERAFRVLAAEDNKTNQLVLSTILEIFGADLTIVDNGRLAVEAAETGTFDVILMDIQMPEMDGITAARTIRRNEALNGGPRVPILAVSANAMAHQVAEYMAAGMDGHVAKPIEINHLQSALERVLSETDEQARAATA
jgi:CheY-like chemotaxis protein